MKLFNFNNDKKVSTNINNNKSNSNSNLNDENINNIENINFSKIKHTTDLPGINLYNTDLKSPVPFSLVGYGFDFPDFVENTLYKAVPAHSSAIKFAVDVTLGNGYKFDDSKSNIKEKANLEAFKRNLNFNIFLRSITQDYRLHNRINIKVIKKSEDIIYFERVSPSRIVYNMDKSLFFYSRDFTIFQQPQEVYKKYEIGCDPGIYMIEFDNMSDKFDPYPLPEWWSAYKYININSKIPHFHEANMENSINPSLVIKRPIKFDTIEERKQYLRGLFDQKGVNATGNVLLFSSSDKDSLPEIQQLEANKNGELFKELRESSIDDICMAHQMNPILIGVKTPGSLGANQEYDIAFQIFEKTVVSNLRNHIEYVINDLLIRTNINIHFTINKKDILE